MSTITTLKLHVPVLLLPSVAVHVTAVVPVGNANPDTGVQATVGVPQLSEPAGVEYVTTEVHKPGSAFCVIVDGQLTVGASPSLTITLKLHVPVLLEASVAVQVTGVVPIEKAKPLTGEHTTEGVPQLSDPVAVNVTTALHCPGSVPCVIVDGHTTVGG